MVLIRLSERHLPDILRLENDLYPYPWTADNFKNEFRRPFTVALGAQKDGQLAGYCFFWLLGPETHLLNVAVARPWQNQGWGRKLLLAMFRIGLAAKTEVFLLEARAGNQAARNLYRSLGFVEVGRRLGYYQEENEDALLMSCLASAAESCLAGGALKG